MKKLLPKLMILCLALSLCASAAAEGAIPIRFATREEGVEMMLSNEKYFEEFSPNKLGFVMENNGASMEEYLAFAGEQVLEWADAEKDLLTRIMEAIEGRFTKNGWTMPPLDTVCFIKTTMLEEKGACGYTHGTQIYLGSPLIERYGQMEMPEGAVPGNIALIVAHELFHCLTRCNPDFRAAMYEIIHFTVQEEDYTLPPSVWDYFIANPDVEHHDSRATFLIDGEEIDCFTAFMTTRHFEKPGDIFFDCALTALVPVDGRDSWYSMEQASNFDEVFGTNTGYVIDPEECMADNFSYAVIYGKDGPNGNGYPNPEIIDAIMDYLQGN